LGEYLVRASGVRYGIINRMIRSGRHFLQIPGPTNIPDRVLRAIGRPIIDHRGAEFAKLATEVSEGLRSIFQTSSILVMYPASGTGAWEAALVNTLSPGDRVLVFETGHFSQLWGQLAQKMGFQVECVPGSWRAGAAPAELESRLNSDKGHAIKAVLVVHNETSTGVTSGIAELRRVINRVGHSALLIVDAISSLGSLEYRHDEWEVDVTVAASQKGLMNPPGLSFNALSQKALSANKTAKTPRSYWDWQGMLKSSETGFFPYTPATNLIYGLQEALLMMREEGLPNIFRRHERHAKSVRAAVWGWGLEIVCSMPHEYSNTVTAVFTPDGHDADQLRATIFDHFDMSLGAGLGKLAGKVFRIGHLGHFNDLMLMGTLSGIEMGLRLAGVPHKKGGLMAALDQLDTAGTATELELGGR
jgi:alanine-glyoxylate transaminase / serine-glyoxylate transaminase / serine-pyruvate transaminase